MDKVAKASLSIGMIVLFPFFCLFSIIGAIIQWFDRIWESEKYIIYFYILKKEPENPQILYGRADPTQYRSENCGCTTPEECMAKNECTNWKITIHPEICTNDN